MASCCLRKAVSTPAYLLLAKGFAPQTPVRRPGEILTATSVPRSPADSPLHEEYYPALPRLQWGGITHEAHHFWMPELSVIWL